MILGLTIPNSVCHDSGSSAGTDYLTKPSASSAMMPFSKPDLLAGVRFADQQIELKKIAVSVKHLQRIIRSVPCALI